MGKSCCSSLKTVYTEFLLSYVTKNDLKAPLFRGEFERSPRAVIFRSIDKPPPPRRRIKRQPPAQKLSTRSQFLLTARGDPNKLSIATLIIAIMNVSLFTEIPQELHESLKDYLDTHPTWDQDRVFSAALSLFLLQNGDHSAARTPTYRACARVYLESVLSNMNLSQST